MYCLFFNVQTVTMGVCVSLFPPVCYLLHPSSASNGCTVTSPHSLLERIAGRGEESIWQSLKDKAC